MRGGGIAHRVGRWAALAACILVAMLYLNSAAYSAWLSSGPRTDVPAWWLHRSFAHLCFAGVALALGVAVFLAFRALRVTRASIVPAVALLLLVMPRVRSFLLVDRCLDSGGRWDAATFSCKH